MACRLAGKPVIQPEPRPGKRTADDEPETGRKSDAVNGAAPGVKKLRSGLSITQNAAGIFGIPRPHKRTAKEQLTPKAKKRAAIESAMAGKRATVKDVPDDSFKACSGASKTSTTGQRDHRRCQMLVLSRHASGT